MEYNSEIEQIRAKFAEGAMASSGKGACKTQEEWEMQGAVNLKRRVLGLCGRETIKSLDELAIILIELKVADSPESGKQLIRELYGKNLVYRGGDYLAFTKTTNRERVEACRILKCDFDPS